MALSHFSARHFRARHFSALAHPSEADPQDDPFAKYNAPTSGSPGSQIGLHDLRLQIAKAKTAKRKKRERILLLM